MTQRIKYLVETTVRDVYSKAPLLTAHKGKAPDEILQTFGPEEHFVVINDIAFNFGTERPDLSKGQPILLTIEAKR